MAAVIPKRHHRVRLWLTDVWPDAFYAMLAIFGATMLLLNSSAAERLSITKLLPHVLATGYLLLLVGTCVGIIGAVIAQRAVIASRCATVLAILIAFNGGAVYIAFGSDVYMTMCGWFMLAILIMNRSYVLARGVVVPSWLVKAVRR